MPRLFPFRSVRSTGPAGPARRAVQPRLVVTPTAETSAHFLLGTLLALGLAGILFFLIVNV